jgi:MoxR-like ATPase
MLRGAVLLLDEIDKASSKIMCLQPVLEGKPLLIKKTNELIFPAAGFNVCSTANTKGQGDDSGKFITSNHLDEAMLERFAIAYEADFPEKSVEQEILNRVLASHSIKDPEFSKHLATWANNIRLTYKQGEEGEVISTRRLVHIANAYAIMTGGTNRLKAIQLCLTRFNPDIVEGWISAYKAIDVQSAPKTAKKTSDIGKAAFGSSSTSASDDLRPW